jgi:transposase
VLVAASPGRLPAVADGLLLPPALATRRRLGPHPSPRADERPRTGGPGGEPDSGDHRQPVSSHRRSKGGARGYDAAKKITGRKRHILTDTDGRLLAVRVHAADVQDRDGAKLALTASRATFPFVETVFADGGYAGRLEAWARAKANVALSIVRRPRAVIGFEPLPRRWIIERSFAWLIKNRRLVRDFEQRVETSEALITIAATATLIRRLR